MITEVELQIPIVDTSSEALARRLQTLSQLWEMAVMLKTAKYLGLAKDLKNDRANISASAQGEK